MGNHGYRGVFCFRIQISPLCSEYPIPCPPPSELSSHALCVSSRNSPFAISHHQHHHHHHPYHQNYHYHHYSTCNSDFSTSICPVPNGTIDTIKATLGFLLLFTVFFSPHDVCVRQYTYKWLFK